MNQHPLLESEIPGPRSQALAARRTARVGRGVASVPRGCASDNASTEALVFTRLPAWLNPAAFTQMVDFSVDLLEGSMSPSRSTAAHSNTAAYRWVLFASAQGSGR